MHREEDREESTGAKDPVLAMLGVGRQLWELEPGDNFVERLRSEDLPVPPPIRPSSDLAGNLAVAVWRRIVSRQGDQLDIPAIESAIDFNSHLNRVLFDGAHLRRPTLSHGLRVSCAAIRRNC